ncbi:hypothetical protein V1226_00325 [Lachnospiraceae bacterium JLR.KK009]
MKWKGYFGTQRQKLRNHKGRTCSFIFACSALVFFLFAAAPAHVKAGGGISAETQKKSGAMVTIDANKKYEGMNAPFSKGYEPSIKKNKMSLTIPFRLEQETKDNRIIVGISFEQEGSSPFYYKNYQKKVKRSEDGIYLYQCQVQLKEHRVNGQYPLRLFVQAQTQEENIQQEFTVYVEITDGIPDSQTGDQKEGPTGADGNSPENDGSEILGNEDAAGEGALGDNPGFSDGSSLPGGTQGNGEISHQPRVMISANSLQGVPLQAGSQTLWSVSAKNCSSKRAMENLKITIISEHKDISFEKTSWYFDRAGAGASMDLSQNVSVGKKAAAEAVPVQFQFEYEDKQGTSYTSTETVSLTIIQTPQAELTGLSFPESIYESDTDLLTFQIQNSGLAVIYNVRVRLEGKGLFPEKELFLGTVEPGSAADGEISVFAGNLCMDNEGNAIEGNGEKYGDTVCTVIFSYENEQGEVAEQKQELKTSIKKPQIVELKVEKEVPKTNQWWITILAGAFLVLILIIVWLYLRMKHYQRISKLK